MVLSLTVIIFNKGVSMNKAKRLVLGIFFIFGLIVSSSSFCYDDLRTFGDDTAKNWRENSQKFEGLKRLTRGSARWCWNNKYGLYLMVLLGLLGVNVVEIVVEESL
jgi:hypothetical protein